MLSHLETQEGSAAALLSWGNTKTWDVYFAARLSDWCTIEAKDSHGGNALMNNYFLASGSKIATKCNISVHFSCTVAWKVPTVKEILQMLKEKGLRMGCTLLRCILHLNSAPLWNLVQQWGRKGQWNGEVPSVQNAIYQLGRTYTLKITSVLMQTYTESLAIARRETTCEVLGLVSKSLK